MSRFLFGLSLFAALIPSGPLCASDLTAVAITGQSAAGGPAGSRYSQFANFFRTLDTAINSSGDVAFQGEMSQFFGGVTSDDNQAIWSGRGDDLDILVREGAQAPSAPFGAVFGSFDSSVVINDQSRVAFSANLRQGSGGVDSSNDLGIWTAGPAGVTQIVREGTQAPGAEPGVVFGSFSNSSNDLLLNNAGQTAFYSRLRDDGGIVNNDNSTSYWLGDGANLQLLAREGDQAPGLTPGAVFDDLSTGGLTGSLNNNGQVIFRASLRQGEGGVTSTNDAALWSTLDGSLSLLAREGDSAPGAPTGARFEAFGEPPRLNDSGTVLFRGFLRSGFGGVTTDNNDGLWSNRDGSISLLYRTGDQAPGAPAGANFDNFITYSMNSSDEIAIYGNLQVGAGGVTEDNDRALWVESGSQLQLVAREGFQAPGTPSGAVFDSFTGRALINSRGQVAIAGALRLGQGGVTEDNDYGIWATDTSGQLQLIAREGDTVQVAPDDSRTITEIRFSSSTGNVDGERSPFSDNGELVFWANLSSFDGIILSDHVASQLLPGDFDENGRVDAADYTVWRDGLGTIYTETDYAIWANNFGAVAGSSIAHSSTVPEPRALLLCFLGLMFFQSHVRLRPGL